MPILKRERRFVNEKESRRCTDGDVLIELGIYPNLSGFDYICKAVYYIMADRTVRMCSAYKMVAKDFDTTSSRVERAIRHALSKADRESEAYKRYMSVKDTKNSAVLHTLAVKLKED